MWRPAVRRQLRRAHLLCRGRRPRRDLVRGRIVWMRDATGATRRRKAEDLAPQALVVADLALLPMRGIADAPSAYLLPAEITRVLAIACFFAPNPGFPCADECEFFGREGGCGSRRRPEHGGHDQEFAPQVTISRFRQISLGAQAKRDGALPVMMLFSPPANGSGSRVWKHDDGTA